MGRCETCRKRDNCTRDIGIIFGGCNVDYKPDVDALYKRLDNLEGCEDNPAYVREIAQIRREISEAAV